MARARPFNLTAQINLRGPANIRAIVSNIRRQLGSVSANVNVNISTAAANSVSRLNSRFRTFNATLATSRNSINDVTVAITNLSAAMRGLPTTPPNIVPPGLPNTTRQLQAARSEMEEFGRQAGLAIRRFAAFSVVTSAVYAAATAVRQGLTAFIEFDKEMVRLQQVTGESATSLGGLAQEVTMLSTSLGASSASLMTVATTLAQAGLTAKDTQKALKAIALSSLAPSFDDMNSTVEGSIALMRQFNIGAGDLESALGSVNAVAARFAVEASDIIAAIQRTGGVFASASRGVSEGTDALNEFIAIFTSVRQTTRESAETIATGLRTIFTRIQRGGTIEALKEFGITLTDAEGKFVGAYKAIQLLSEGLNSIDPRDLKFSQIVEELGGFRQIGKVIPLIQQFATAQQALAVAQKGAGSLTEDAATAQLSLANQLSKVREEFLALFREIGGSDSFQMMAKAALSIASALIKVADAAKNVIPIIGTIMAIRGIQGLGQFATGLGAGVRRRGAVGGRMGYASGDMVDVALMPGEAVLYPEQAKRVGTANLRKMNYADKRMAKGGVAQVPGSGRSDSFYTQLPAGSFVIRKDATEALGMNRIAEIASGKQKFRNGGNVQKLMAGEYAEAMTPAQIRKIIAAYAGKFISSDREFYEQISPFLKAAQIKSPLGGLTASALAQALIDNPNLEKEDAKKILLRSLKTYGIPVDPETGRMVFQGLSLRPPKGETQFTRNVGGMDVDIRRASPPTHVARKLENAMMKGIYDIHSKMLSISLTAVAKKNPDIKQELIEEGIKFNRRGQVIPKGPAFIARINNAIAQSAVADIMGGMFQGHIGGLGAEAGASSPGKAAPMDFNKVGKIVASLFSRGAKIAANFVSEAKLSASRTYVGPDAKPTEKGRGLLSQILRRLRLRKAANGGEIPIMAEKGEYVINKHAAQSIGYNNLHKMNKYHSGGVVGSKPQKFVLGGVVGAMRAIPATVLKLLQSLPKIFGTLPKIFGRLAPSLKQFGDIASRFFTNIARVPRGGGWLGGSPVPGMPATGTGTRAAARGRTPGATPEENRRSSTAQNAAFALSMVVPVVTEMMSNRDEPVTAESARSQAFTSGAGGAAGIGLAIASMGGRLGIFGGIAAAGVGLVKAFADAENAAREFTIKLKTDDLNDAIEKTNKSLDKFSNNMTDAAIRNKAIADVLSTIGKAEDVQKASEKPMVGLFNLLDSGIGVFERSVVLFNNGIMAYLRTLELFSGEEGAKLNTAMEFEKSIPRLSKERATQYSGAADASSRLMEIELRRTGSLDALKVNAAEFNKLSRSLALADAQVQREIMTVQNNAALSDAEKKSIIDNIVARNAESKVLELQTRVLRAKAIEDLNKAANRTSFSLERVFSSLEQSVNAAAYAVEKLGQNSELVAASMSGQARIGRTNIDAINVLQNPRAYSTEQNRAATSLGGSAFGPALSDSMRGLLEFGPKLEDVIMSTINETVASTPREELNNEMIAARIGTAVNKSLDALGLPPDLTSKLSAEVGKTLEEMRKEGEDKVDFSQLMERIPALAKTLQSATRAQEAAIAALENWQNTLNKYSEAFNAILALQIQNNERLRESSDRLFQAQIDLAKTFGGQTDLRKVVNNFKANIASMSGGFTTVGDITANIQRLEQLRQQQQALQNDAGNRGLAGIDAFKLMTDQLNDTTLKLRENVAALEKMSQSTELASAAMSKIAELQQKQQAGIGIMEKMVTSTPQDIATFSKALSRLQVNMRGGAIRGTTSAQRGETLEAFNMIAPLLGERQNEMRANVLESMMREINAPITPFFRDILNSMRNPKADPEMAKAIGIYERSLQEQQAATLALRTLNDITIKQTSEDAAQMIVNGITGATLKFEQQQLKEIKEGINELVGLVRGRGPAAGAGAAPAAGAAPFATGGVVYASAGKLINFKSRGTDTVPAMLTPGEFVVNKAATQKNLPLLKSINSGGAKAYSRGGVAYLADGGVVTYDLSDMAGRSIINETFTGTDRETSNTYLTLSDAEFNKLYKRFIAKDPTLFETVFGIKPVAYASATNPLGIRYGVKGANISDELIRAADRIGAMKVKPLPSTSAPASIMSEIGSAGSAGMQDADSILSSRLSQSFMVPSHTISSVLSELVPKKLTFLPDEDPAIKIANHSLAYKLLLKNIPDYKIEPDSFISPKDGTKILLPSGMSDKLPSLTPSISNSGNTIKLSGLSKLADDFFGPITLDQYRVGAGGNLLDNPLGFAQYRGGAFIGSNVAFDVVSGASNIGTFHPLTGIPHEIMGGRIYGPQHAPLHGLSTDTSHQDVVKSMGMVQGLKAKIQQSLANLETEKIVESQGSEIYKSFQQILSNLYNNRLFSALINPSDIIANNLADTGADVPKSPFTLYNIRDRKRWEEFIGAAIEKPPGSYSPSLDHGSTFPIFEFAPTGDITGARSFPFTMKGFVPHEGIENKLKTDFQAANKMIKEAIPATYTKNKLNFPYTKIKGPYYDNKINGFRNEDKEFVVVPLHKRPAQAFDPFSEAALDNTFGWFSSEDSLDQKVNDILGQIQRDPDALTFRSETIKNIPLAGDYDPLTKNNAYDISSAGFKDIAFPNFAKAYQNLLGEAGMGGVRPNVPGVVDVDAKRVDDVASFFDLVNTDFNLKAISSKTVRGSDVSGIAASLRYKLFDINKPNMLPQYSQYLSMMAGNLGRDPRFVKIKKFGPRGQQETYKEINEKAAKLYARLLVSGEFFSALASRDVGALGRFLGEDPMDRVTMFELGVSNNLKKPGATIAHYIHQILSKSNDRMSSIMSQSIYDKVLGQKTDALKDAMADPAAIMEMADIDQDTGEIKGWKKVDATAAPDKTVAQIASLALNPYNFFDPKSRWNLINGVMTPFSKQLAKYEASKVKPQDLIRRTLDILGNLNTVSMYFHNKHDALMNYPLRPDQLDDIKAGAANNALDPAQGTRDAVTKILERDPRLLKNFDERHREAAAAYAELTGGANKLIGLNLATPLPNETLLIDLFIKRLNIVAGRGKPAAPPAAGAAPGAGAAPAAGAAPFATGGVVYASAGKLINFQPRGTDTVPAMLTPGEFVVNAKATKQNLGLLKSINGGATGYQKGGIVYLQQGSDGPVSSTSTSSSTNSSDMGGSYQLTISQDARDFLTALQQSIGDQGFGAYVSRLEKLATSFPDKIEVKIVPPDTPIQINITGAAAIEELGKADTGIRKNVMDQVNKELSKIWQDSGGQMGTRPR